MSFYKKNIVLYNIFLENEVGLYNRVFYNGKRKFYRNLVY